LCTYPVEYLAASRPDANPEPTWQLYSALATSAGVSRPVRANDPRVIVGGLRAGDQDAYVLLNCSPATVDAELVVTGKPVYQPGAGNAEGLSRTVLAPYEVSVLYTR
jgi:hypothetical protein